MPTKLPDKPADWGAPETTERRLIRIETKISKLMFHLGISADGKPLPQPTPKPPTTTNLTKESK